MHKMLELIYGFKLLIPYNIMDLDCKHCIDYAFKMCKNLINSPIIIPNPRSRIFISPGNYRMIGRII